MSDNQAQLDEMLRRFATEYPDISKRLDYVPVANFGVRPTLNVRAEISAGSISKPHGLAYVGTSTR